MTFKSDLARGHKGEQLLMDRYPILQKSGTLDYDFITPSGQAVESKCDSTTHSNFFMEIVSNSNKNSPGGAFQSIFKKADYLCYMFEKSGLIYTFRLTDLVWWLYNNKEKYALKKVWNPNYTTYGQAIPIADLEHLCVEPEKMWK